MLIKDNYKIYLDITMKDGLIFSGTIVKAKTQTVFTGLKSNTTESDYNYFLETDNGEYIKCASKVAEYGMVQLDEFESSSWCLTFYNNLLSGIVYPFVIDNQYWQNSRVLSTD